MFSYDCSLLSRFLLRCDCPTDVVIIGRDSPFYGETRDIPWRHAPFGTPPALQSFNGTTADAWKVKGRELFQKKAYSQALEAYRVALQMASEDGALSRNIHLNLAQTCTCLGYFEQALTVSMFIKNTNCFSPTPSLKNERFDCLISRFFFVQ